MKKATPIKRRSFASFLGRNLERKEVSTITNHWDNEYPTKKCSNLFDKM